MTDAVLTAGLAIVASVLTAMVTARLQATAELRKWEREMKLSFAATSSTDVEAARRLGEQFAVGFVKVLSGEQRERFFIPANARITIGRGKENYIDVNEPGASRRHCGLASDERNAYLEDYGSTSGVLVNGQRQSGRGVALADGDIITIGATELQYWRLER